MIIIQFYDNYVYDNYTRYLQKNIYTYWTNEKNLYVHIIIIFIFRIINNSNLY